MSVAIKTQAELLSFHTEGVNSSEKNRIAAAQHSFQS
jgi:hypothetical protein